MNVRRIVKRIVFSAVPVLVLFVAAEAVLRVKYFRQQKNDWNYITMPFKVLPVETEDHSSHMAPQVPVATSPSPPASSGQVPRPQSTAPTSLPAPPVTTASTEQMQFKAMKPCRDRDVWSDHYQKPMPYTWDDNCFRGDPVHEAKPPGEIRVFVLGGSTVQDEQPDIDMWSRRIREELGNPHVRVVNAGQAGMDSQAVEALYSRKISRFAADVVLYYEAWNEQIAYSQWRQIDKYIGSFGSWWHNSLYYKSAVYTYLVEKYSFRTQKAVKYWKIDVRRLERNLERLSRNVQESGARFVFVTQVTKFPRYWKGVDTYQPEAVEALLGRLEKDPAYTYDLYEISALNQRWAVFRSIQLCSRLKLPVINVLSEFEALGEAGRARVFMDLGHLKWEGTWLLGKLVAKQLIALGVLDARATPAASR